MMHTASKWSKKSVNKVGELLFEMYEERMRVIYNLLGQEIIKKSNDYRMRMFDMSVFCKNVYLLTNRKLFESIYVYSKQQINSSQGGEGKWNIVPAKQEVVVSVKKVQE
jgi:hypothetical protein